MDPWKCLPVSEYPVSFYVTSVSCGESLRGCTHLFNAGWRELQIKSWCEIRQESNFSVFYFKKNQLIENAFAQRLSMQSPKLARPDAFFHNNGQNMVDCTRKYYHLIKHDYLIQIILKQL